MSVRTYNPSVRVGNWNEDIQLEEDTLKDFLQKRESGELLYQKRTKLEQTIFKKVDLSISRDGFVHFGDKVNIRCPGALDKTKYFAHVAPRADCQLAVLPQINKILYSQKFEAPCSVTGSKDLTPNLRSTFVIKRYSHRYGMPQPAAKRGRDDTPPVYLPRSYTYISVHKEYESSCQEMDARILSETTFSKDGSRDGDPLRYNQVFYLCTMDNEGGSLYLHSDRVTLHKSPNKSRHQEVSLVAEPSQYTEWQIQHIKPKLRFEYEGSMVPANDKVIINHVVTNQDLCVEEDICSRTSFGTSEYEMTACTMLDSHRAEKEQNHWRITMGMPGDEIYPVQTQLTQTTQPTSSSEVTSSQCS